MADIHDVTDYTIVQLEDAGESLNHLKLQKLLYYSQAWHLALRNRPLFDGRFQAWVHGPVSRTVYERFSNKSLYSTVGRSDVRAFFSLDRLTEADREHIDDVLEAYAAFSGSELEEMTHREAPWLRARDGYGATQRCEVLLDENLMGEYYRARVTSH